MVVFDSSILILVLHPGSRAPKDKHTGKPVTFASERVEHLLRTLDKDRETILIPAPALAEVLAGAVDAIAGYNDVLNKSRFIVVSPFDHRAAVESAVLFGVGRRKGGKRGSAKGAWQKIKVDQQIVAIAAVNNAANVYTCDDDVEALCTDVGLSVSRLEDLEVPKDSLQVEMELQAELEASTPTPEPPEGKEEAADPVSSMDASEEP